MKISKMKNKYINPLERGLWILFSNHSNGYNNVFTDRFSKYKRMKIQMRIQ